MDGIDDHDVFDPAIPAAALCFAMRFPCFLGRG